MSCLNQAYYRKPNGKIRTEEEVEEYMKSLSPIPPPPHNEEDKDIVEIINDNQEFIKIYNVQRKEIERLNEELEIRDILIKGIDKRIDNHFKKIDRCVFEDTNKLIEIQDLIKKAMGSDKK